MTARLWGSCYFQIYQTKRLYIHLGNHLLPCLQTKHHRTESLESARLSSFFHVTTISSFFIKLTSLFAFFASSIVGRLIFLSKSLPLKRISGSVCVANQLNCPIKVPRLCISVSLSTSFLSSFQSNFKDSMGST